MYVMVSMMDNADESHCEIQYNLKVRFSVPS